MKQVLQSVRSGMIRVAEVPRPRLEDGQVLVHVAASVVSSGTERMAVEFAQKGLLGKARSRPDLVRQVIEKVRRDGLLTALDAVENRLDQPLALGYTCAGTVIEVGPGVDTARVGDRVACAGAGYAVHAEIVSVPKNLIVKLPEEVNFESAAFTTIGAIALHGLRLADVKLGESIAVVGLGLIGLLAVQLARAAGCRVSGMDPNRDRCSLAEQLGCETTATTNEGMEDIVNSATNTVGVDAVIIAAATPSNDPVELAGSIARDRGCVVAVGAVGTVVPRKLYYEKELEFRISRSYGPGRYDPGYEEKGQDYPIGYVRWTETRNMQSFVQLLAEGKVTVKSLITHRFLVEEAHHAYDLVTGKDGQPFLGIVITYSDRPNMEQTITLSHADESVRSIGCPQGGDAALHRPITIGLLGAGNFATSVLLPAMKKVSDTEFIGVCTATGAKARHVGDKFGFRYCTTDERRISNDPEIHTIVVATRHHLHACQVVAALDAGKHVFCEKPLCIEEVDLKTIARRYTASTLYQKSRPLLMVGYNRRFAPMAFQLKAFLADVRDPLVMHYRVNAGSIPLDHWIHDPEQGGGRIIGEVCHFVDFLTFLAGSLPVQVRARSLANGSQYHDDNVVITVEFGNGSLGTITYVANGDTSFSKERVEVFGGGSVAVLDDFRSLGLTRDGRRKIVRSWLRRDKGHRKEWEHFIEALQTGVMPIPFEEIVSTSLTTFRICDALQTGTVVPVAVDAFIADAFRTNSSIPSSPAPDTE